MPSSHWIDLGRDLGWTKGSKEAAYLPRSSWGILKAEMRNSHLKSLGLGCRKCPLISAVCSSRSFFSALFLQIGRFQDIPAAPVHLKASRRTLCPSFLGICSKIFCFVALQVERNWANGGNFWVREGRTFNGLLRIWWTVAFGFYYSEAVWISITTRKGC